MQSVRAQSILTCHISSMDCAQLVADTLTSWNCPSCLLSLSYCMENSATHRPVTLPFPTAQEIFSGFRFGFISPLLANFLFSLLYRKHSCTLECSGFNICGILAIYACVSPTSKTPKDSTGFYYVTSTGNSAWHLVSAL